MSDRDRATLEELEILENRIAAHTARLDQLQAESRDRAASHIQPRLLVGVQIGVFAGAAILAEFLTPRSSTSLLVALGLGASALALALANATIRSQDVRGSSAQAPRPWAVARWRMVSWWRTSRRRTPRRASVSRREEPVVSLLFGGALASLACVPLLGGVAVSAFALLLSGALLQANKRRREWFSGFIGIATVAVAIGATVSVGAWAGTYTRAVVRDQVSLPHARIGTATGTASETGTLADEPNPGRTYQQICGSTSWRGDGSGPALVHLRDAWKSDGALLAGCPTTVLPASSDGSVIASVGRCERGQVESLGIADDRHAIVLLGAAIEPIEELVRERILTSAPTHLVVGGGDLYVVPTTAGTYAYTHSAGASRSSSGSEGSVWRGQPCTGSSGPPLVALSPPTTAAWVTAMSQAKTWLWPTPSRVENGRNMIGFGSETTGTHAEASCSPSGESCVLSIGASRQVFGTESARSVSSEQLLSLAPQAP